MGGQHGVPNTIELNEALNMNALYDQVVWYVDGYYNDLYNIELL